ncbi:teneurin-a-like [Drosophila ficusphila]|uniref:teneurin-a-like n=1 Tax=Drosophila ficusphila TaxID=30025 RepID=UPI001C8911A1|nr:teneurin-a-like [Drosophila ficusphila]
MTMKSMKYSDCDTIMDGYNPVPPPLPRRVPPVRNIYAEPFAHEPNHSSRYVTNFKLHRGSSKNG